MDRKASINILYGISISTAVIFSILIVGINNKITLDIEEIRSGDVYANTITKDKLAEDVFNTVNLELEDGATISAKLVKATIKDGTLTNSLEFETEKGEIYSAKVLNTGISGDVLTSIADGSITEEKLSTIVVTKLNATTTTGNFEIADGSIVTAKLANGAVTSEKLADGSIGTIKLLDGSITSSKLVNGVILTQHLANSSVTTFTIADNAITTTKLLDNVITSAKIQNDAVGTTQIANGAITTIKLGDGSVTEMKIVDGNVTEGKLASGSVTAFKIGDNAVITAKIEDGAVTEAKLASGSISLSKLSNAMCGNGETLLKSGGVWTCSTAGGSGVETITAGAGIINSGTPSDPILDANVDDITIEISGDVIQIKDGAITNSKLADSSITSAKIENGTIIDANISASASIAWSKVSKTGSSISDLDTRNFSDLNGRNANLLSITDAENYFTSNNVEGALEELGANSFMNGGNAFGAGARLGTIDPNTLSLITNNSAAITILSNGNVGIGDTTPLSLFTVGANDAFQVNNLGVIVSAAGITSSGQITFNSFNTAGLVINTSAGLLSSTPTIGASYITNNSLNFAQFANAMTLDASTDIAVTGTNVFSVTNSGTGLSFRVNDQSGDTTPFVVDANGSVGIGTTTPSAMFSVGNAFLVNNTGNITRVGDAANSIVYSTGTLTITSAGSLALADTNLTSPVLVTLEDGSLNVNLRQGIVDAINDLYALSTGGSTIWSETDDVVHPTSTSDSVAIGGSTSSASFFFNSATELLTLTNTTSGLSFRVNDQAGDTTPFVIDANGNVGIGTSAPGQKLDVVGNGYFSGAIGMGTDPTGFSNAILFPNGSVRSTGSEFRVSSTSTNALTFYTNNSERARFDSNGNFVVGSTTASGRLQSTVSNSVVTANTYAGYFQNLATNTVTNNINKFGLYVVSTGNFAGGVGDQTSNYGLYIDSISGADNNYSAVFANGNVGIGDTSPASLLTVGPDDAFQINSSGNIISIGGDSHTINSSINGLTISSALTGLVIQEDGDIDVHIAGGSSATGCTINNITGDLTCSGTISGATGGSYWDRTGTILSPATAGDIMNITSGTTTAPVMSIVSSGAVTSGDAAGLNVLVSNSSTNIAAVMITNQGTGLSFVVNDDVSDTTPFVIDANGNVGIGTSTPNGAKLEIAGGGLKLANAQSIIWRNAAHSADINAITLDSSNNLQIANVNNFQSAVTFLVDTITNRTGNMTIGTSGSNSLNLQSNGNSRLSILANGNIGIGDTSPASLFTVGASDAFQINSSGNIVAIGGSAHTINSSGAGLNINANAYGLNLQTDGNIDVHIAGGAGATGCTINNTTGDLTCSGTVSGASGGSYWGRSGSTLSPAASDDTLAMVQGASGIVTVDFKNLSVISGGSFNTTAVGLTNYSAHFVNNSTVSSGSNPLTNVALYVSASGGNNNYSAIFGDGNVGVGTNNPTAKFETVNSGAKTNTNYAAIIQNTSTNTTTDGINKYALQLISTGSFTGSNGTATNNYGLYVNTVSGADNNYSAVFAGGNVGIGTATPLDILEVSGNIRLGGSGNQLRDFNGSNLLNNTSGTLNLGSTSITTGSIYTVAAGGTTSFRRNVTTDLHIGANGNLAVGGTTTTQLFNVGSSAQFQINSTGNIVAIGGVGHTIQNSSGALNIDSASTSAINIGTSANAKVITMGNTTSTTGIVLNSGTGSITMNSSASTGNGFVFNANSLSSGNGLYVSSTSTAFTTGSLGSIYWNPATTRISTGDIFTLNVGANGVVNNIFNVKNAGNSLFAVTQSQVRSNVPMQIAAPGDVSFAYDLLFTNATESFIKSTGAFTIQAGEIFNSSNLTLKTFNNGSIVIDAPGGMESLHAQTWTLADSTTALDIQSGLLNFDTLNTRLGVGTSSPNSLFSVGTGSEFQVNNSGAIVAATGLTSTGSITFTDLAGCASGLQTDGSGVLSCLPSDSSLKNNVTTINNALNIVSGLRGVSYNWNPSVGLGAQTEFGLIAQEVQTVAPELVFTMSTGKLGVKYNQLTGLLVNAVKEQQVQIDELRSAAGLLPGVNLITASNIFDYFNTNIIPNFTVVKIKINDKLIARSVDIIEDATFYGQADFNSTINAKNKINVGNDSAGRVTISSGEKHVDINFSSEYLDVPIVTVTPTGEYILNNSIKYSVVNVTTSGFRIEIDSTKSEDINFNWIVFGLNNIAPVSYPGVL